MHICMCVCLIACMPVCLYVWLYVCMPAWLYVWMCAGMYVCMFMCVYVCMYACMYVYMYGYVCMYVYGRLPDTPLRALFGNRWPDTRDDIRHVGPSPPPEINAHDTGNGERPKRAPPKQCMIWFAGALPGLCRGTGQGHASHPPKDGAQTGGVVGTG